MKTLKRSITVLVCLILFASCTQSIDYTLEQEYFETKKGITYYKGTPFTGNTFINYKNGQLEYKEIYKHGKKIGLDESYYKNGQLKYKRNYKDGKEIGLNEQYYENVQL
jgi:antitoxin component YwqK of YwqJK toxin-antitoxin module